MGGKSGRMRATEEMAGDRQSANAPTVALPHESLKTANPAFMDQRAAAKGAHRHATSTAGPHKAAEELG